MFPLHPSFSTQLLPSTPSETGAAILHNFLALQKIAGDDVTEDDDSDGINARDDADIQTPEENEASLPVGDSFSKVINS